MRISTQMFLTGDDGRYRFVSGVLDCSVSGFLLDVVGCGVMFVEKSCSSLSSIRLLGDFDCCLGFVLPILID